MQGSPAYDHGAGQAAQLEALLQSREPRRATMREHYRQLLKVAKEDGRHIKLLRKELVEVKTSFREALHELVDVCRDESLPADNRVASILSIIEEALET